MFGSFGGIAGGGIKPSRFVIKSSYSSDAAGVLLQAGANAHVWGISQPSTRRAPLAGWDDGNAAVAGDQCNVFGPGDDEAPLELGAAVYAGQEIKSDADGKGVPATADGDFVGAVAIRSGAAGDIIPVKPMRYELAAAAPVTTTTTTTTTSTTTTTTTTT